MTDEQTFSSYTLPLVLVFSYSLFSCSRVLVFFVLVFFVLVFFVLVFFVLVFFVLVFFVLVFFVLVFFVLYSPKIAAIAIFVSLKSGRITSGWCSWSSAMLNIPVATATTRA